MFTEYVEKKVRKTIRKHKLFMKRDKIAVAVSGGKDSTACLYILNKLGYKIEAVSVDASIGKYTRTNMENLQKVCKKYKIPLHIISFRKEFGRSLCYIRDMLKSKGIEYSSCMLCGILRRYLLNKHTREMGFDILVTGHNLDDEAQGFLMNVFRNDYKLALRQGPKPGIIKSKKFVQRVKPLYDVTEAEVIKYTKALKFPVNYERCPCSSGAYRRQFIDILDKFEEKHPSVKYNVLKFLENMGENAKKTKAPKMTYCKACGEPSANEVCKTCKIFELLK